MRRASRSILLSLMVAFAAIANGPVAYAEPGKCRVAIVKQLAAYGRAALVAVQRCEDAVVTGKRPADTECEAALDVVDALAKAGAKVDKAVAAKCGGKNKQCDPADTGTDADDALSALGWEGVACPAPSSAGCVATIDDCGDVASCLRCAGAAPARDVAAAAYDAFTPAATSDKALRKCQRAIGNETAKLFAAIAKLGAGCWSQVNAGEAGFTAPCPSGDASGATLAKIAAAREKARARICKACGGRDGRCATADDELTVAAVGFATTCPAVTVPHGAACAGAVDGLDALATCATCVAEFHATCLGAVGTPWGTSYPAFCAAAAGLPLAPLPGSPADPLTDATFDFMPQVGFAPGEVTDGVVRTRIGVTFEDGATLGQANAVLTAVQGEVISMLAGLPILLVRIPDPGTLAALDAIIAQVDAAAGVDYAVRDLAPEPQVLPAKYPRPLGRDVTADPGLDLLKHLIAARIPAAWNAVPPHQNAPTLIVADLFGDGPPINLSFAVSIPHPDDFVIGMRAPHGYDVLGMAAARLTGQAPNCLTDSVTVDRRPCAVGLYPSVESTQPLRLPLRAVDIRRAGGVDLSVLEIEDAILARVSTERSYAESRGYPTGGVVVNTSLASPATVGNVVEARRHARFWIQKVRGKFLESAFLHATGAGNIVIPTPVPSGVGPTPTPVIEAVTASPFTAAALIDGLGVPHLGNVLVVENRTVGGYPFVPGSLFVESKRGGHLSAVAADVWTVSGTRVSGTSMAAPQVAALAAFVWQIRPVLTAPEVRQQLIGQARPESDGAPTMDAFGTVLASDVSFTDAPIRKSILDITRDGTFNAADVARFFTDWGSADTLLGRLYSRVDLRGARGAEDVAFDLDLNGAIAGATVTVEQRTAATYQASFNEAAVERDEDIVCHYAFTPLYTKDPVNMVDAGQRQCCEWLRDNGRVPAETPCYSCPPGRGFCEPPGDQPVGGWTLFCGDGRGFNPGFALLEDGTMMEGVGLTFWNKTGTWSTDGANISITYCPVDPFSGRATFSFEGTWSPAPVPPEFGVQSCTGAALADCPAMKGTLTVRNSFGQVVRTVACDSRRAGAFDGWRPFADPRDQRCHGGCFESWELRWPHLCAPERFACGRFATFGCQAEPNDALCPDGLVCRAVLGGPPNGFGCRCVPQMEEACTVTADCPPDMTCCPGGSGCGPPSTPWLRSLCIHDPDVP